MIPAQQDIVANIPQALVDGLQFQQVHIGQPLGLQPVPELLGPGRDCLYRRLFLGRVLGRLGGQHVLHSDFPGGDLLAELHGALQGELLIACGADIGGGAVAVAPAVPGPKSHGIGRFPGGLQVCVVVNKELDPVLAPDQVPVYTSELDFFALCHGVLLNCWRLS